MKMNDLEKDSVRRLKIDDSADGQRLDNFLMARLKGVPKSRIYKMVRGGEVRINGGRVDVSYRLQAGRRGAHSAGARGRAGHHPRHPSAAGRHPAAAAASSIATTP
jgi:hypothetical protein